MFHVKPSCPVPLVVFIGILRTPSSLVDASGPYPFLLVEPVGTLYVLSLVELVGSPFDKLRERLSRVEPVGALYVLRWLSLSKPFDKLRERRLRWSSLSRPPSTGSGRAGCSLVELVETPFDRLRESGVLVWSRARARWLSLSKPPSTSSGGGVFVGRACRNTLDELRERMFHVKRQA